MLKVNKLVEGSEDINHSKKTFRFHDDCISRVNKLICILFLWSLGCVQTGATTPNVVAPTLLGVVACVLAVVCKRMQQLPTSLGPAVHRGKNATHKSL